MKIKIIDDLHPEDNAMLQALYSRSPASVDDHLEKVQERGSGKFLERYYVGYGHQSIGDCGSTTVFIEGVSMLVAKAIQQWPLYSGQEASTRYMDFGEVEFLNPAGTNEGLEIQETWRRFYVESLPAVREHVALTHPDPKPGESSKAYERAVNARAFDIMRAWLPAGATTNLSWHTNLRQASDHLKNLVAHPDPYVCAAATAIWRELEKRYAHSFTPVTKLDPTWSRYCHEVERSAAAPLPDDMTLRGLNENEVAIHVDLRDPINRPGVKALLAGRARGQLVPRFLEQAGVIRSTFPLDFGSWRDLQRHRNGFVTMPLLRMTRPHWWYMDQLPGVVREEARDLFSRQKARIGALDVTPTQRQYYVPMGCLMTVSVTQSLPAWVYRVELRSSKMVHPTLRQATLAEVKMFNRSKSGVANWVTLHVDDDPDDWDVRRGTQTITEKT